MDYKYYYNNINGQDDYGFKGIDENGYGIKCNKFIYLRHFKNNFKISTFTSNNKRNFALKVIK